MKKEHCRDCGVEIPKTKYSKKFRAFLCTKCRKRNEDMKRWNNYFEYKYAKEARKMRREQKKKGNHES